MRLELEIEGKEVKSQEEVVKERKEKKKKPSIALKLQDVDSVSELWPTVHASQESDWDVVAIEEAKEGDVAATTAAAAAAAAGVEAGGEEGAAAFADVGCCA